MSHGVLGAGGALVGVEVSMRSMEVGWGGGGGKGSE